MGVDYIAQSAYGIVIEGVVEWDVLEEMVGGADLLGTLQVGNIYHDELDKAIVISSTYHDVEDGGYSINTSEYGHTTMEETDQLVAAMERLDVAGIKYEGPGHIVGLLVI